MPKDNSLDSVIVREIELGEKDPLTIAKKLIQRNDKHWLAAELCKLAEDIIAERARQEIGKRRRSFEIALKPGDNISQGDMKLAGIWIPAADGLPAWKRVADVTADDLERRAAYHENFAAGAMRRASWCRDVAGMMRNEGAATLGDLKADLPALPDDADLPALVAA